jgi:hypothetical protein
MSPTRKTQTTLIVLFTITLVTFLAWACLRRQANPHQPPVTPTATINKSLVVDIPQKALWKNYVTVSAEAKPGAICKLIYIPPSGETLQMDVTANSGGLCEWRWIIDETQGKGSSRLILIIDGISETHFMEIWPAF